MTKNEYFRETAAKIAEGIAASNSLNLATTANVDKAFTISINVARKLTDYFDKEGHFTEAQ
ncbi:MAG TPA: hypothetical protein PLI74_12565 [Candidatus Kapabacteria bacterium]|nr:hypothetical protein [Candidatus Kapabacteria bacterium]